jgi:hypothetical protein
MCFFAIKTENKSGQTFFIYLSILMNVSAVLLTFVWFRSRYLFLSGLPGFYWSKHTKLGKIYQMTNNYSKRPYMITNGRKIFQMVIKSTYISIPRPSEIYPKLGFLVRKKTSGNPGFYSTTATQLRNSSDLPVSAGRINLFFSAIPYDFHCLRSSRDPLPKHSTHS